MSTAVLVVGVILLVTTLIGGLLLIARSEESLTANAYQEGAITKVLISGSADQHMAASLSNVVNSLPQSMGPSGYPVAPAAYPPR